MQLQSIRHETGGKYEKIGSLLLAMFLSSGILCCFMTGFRLTLGEGGILGGNLKGGMIFLWNGTADFLGKSRFIVLNQYQDGGDGCGLFLLFVWMLLTAVSYGFLRSGNRWWMLLCLIPFFTLQLVLGITSEVWAVGLLFWAILTAAVCSSLSGKGKLLAAFLLLIMIGAVTGGVQILTHDSYTAPAVVEQVSRQMHQTVEKLRYGTNPRGDGALSPKDFDSEETALEVKMENPTSLYLRGFVGGNYQKGRWEPLTCNEYYEQNTLFYWLHRQNFSGLTQMRQVSDLLDKEQEAESVQVENRSASRKYIYTPYEMGSINIPRVKNWSDSFLTSENITGAGSYEFETLPNMVSNWPALSAELFTRKDGSDLRDYRIKESHYNVQIYEDYTEITKSQKKLVSRYLGSLENRGKDHADYKKAVHRIQTCLEESFVYTQRVTESEKPVEDFLTSKKGCDVHYASAATLMFRYYGIPARYVEGYILTPEDVKDKKSGDIISIPGSANHAWVEIYIDSFGWVPLEATPEYYGRMEQPDLSKGLEYQGAAGDFKNYDQMQAKEQRDAEPESKPESETVFWKLILLFTAFNFLAAVSAGLLVRLFQKLVAVRRRKKAFYDRDVRKAVCAVYAYMKKAGMPVGEAAETIGNRAAYSFHETGEQERKFMLEELERMKRGKYGKTENRSDYGNRFGTGLHRLRRERR